MDAEKIIAILHENGCLIKIDHRYKGGSQSAGFLFEIFESKCEGHDDSRNFHHIVDLGVDVNHFAKTFPEAVKGAYGLYLAEVAKRPERAKAQHAWLDSKYGTRAAAG